MVGNKIANKITEASRTSPQSSSENIGLDREIPEKIYISSERREKIIGNLNLIVK